MNAKVMKDVGLQVASGYYGIGISDKTGSFTFLPHQNKGLIPKAIFWRIDGVDNGALIFYPDDNSHEFVYHSYGSINSEGNFVINWKNITVPSNGTTLTYIALG